MRTWPHNELCDAKCLSTMDSLENFPFKEGRKYKTV